MSSVDIDDIQPGDLPLRLGRYELVSILGKGGFAQVFEAELNGPAGFRKRVAVKIIKLNILARGEREHVDFFIREARLGGLLKHPNIVDVYELGETDGQLYIAMELVQGQTLRGFLRDRQKAPRSVLLEIAAGITAGLSSAHELRSEGMPAGLVHRDLKPSNILIATNGAVKIADFGVAVTLHGELASKDHSWREVHGTISYMSPEQLLGWPLDGRSDLFSLGVVLTELASQSSLPRRLIHDIVQRGEHAERCLVPSNFLDQADEGIPGIRPILDTLLQFKAENRYGNAEALLDDIDALREIHGVFPRVRTWLQTTPLPEDSSTPDPREIEPTEKSKPALPDKVARAQRSTPTHPFATNLVDDADRFVGRKEELLELRNLFDSGETLVTIKSTGGAGKTRLAVHYARSVFTDYPGGVWFMDLTEARTPDGVVQVVANVLEIPLGNQPLEGQLTRLSHALATRGKTLILFDNVEQVVAHSATTFGRWKAAAPEACFLITTREPTRLEGERILALKPLSLEEGVLLFKDRALATGAELSLDTSAQNAIENIVQSVDGLPLSIELAAARASVLSPSQILQRVSETFQLLRSNSGPENARQKTLEDLIDWSWNLLAPWEKAALAQLSVFRGGFFMESAEAVLDLSDWPEAPWPIDVVGALFDKSLLNRWEAHGQPRFGMYASIQEFAAEKLGDQTLAARCRHAEYFAVFGTERFMELTVGREAPRHRDTLALESENLLAATHLPKGQSDEASALCANAAATDFRIRGPYSEAIACLKGALQKTLPTYLQIRLMLFCGRMHHLSGQLPVALTYYQPALELARASNDTHQVANAHNRLAHFYGEQGLKSEAAAEAKAGLKLARSLGDPILEAILLHRVATLHDKRGNVDTAVHLMLESIEIAESVGHIEHALVGTSHLGLLMQRLGRISDATKYQERALRTARQIGNRRNEGITLGNLGIRYKELGEPEKALEHFQMATRLARGLGNKRSEAINLGNQGDLLFEQGELERAKSLLHEAIALGDKHVPVASGAFRATLAVIAAEGGDLDQAWRLLARAEPDLKNFDTHEHAKMLLKKAQVALLAKETGLAKMAFNEADAMMTMWPYNPRSDLSRLLKTLRPKFRI